jgi:hypothetical protein
MVSPLDIIEPTWRSLSDLDYGHWIVHFAESLAKHEDHRGEGAFPPPIAGPPKLTEYGNQMIAVAMDAQGGDRFKRAERDAFRPKLELMHTATIQWVVSRSLLENRPSMIENLPLALKKKSTKSSSTTVLGTPSKLKATHGEHTGSAYISIGKVPNASMYYIQICQGNPNDEEAWMAAAQSDTCRKVLLPGLTPGGLYHFRVRCFGAGQYSPWSQVVTLRIL